MVIFFLCFGVDLQIRAYQAGFKDLFAGDGVTAVATLPCGFAFFNGCEDYLGIVCGDTVSFFVSLFDGEGVTMRNDGFVGAFLFNGVDGVEVVL